jgi:hypothetical protein
MNSFTLIFPPLWAVQATLAYKKPVIARTDNSGVLP